MRYMLDTNICVHLLRGNRAVAEHISRVGEGNCHISEITVAELLFGEFLACSKGRASQRGKLQGFLDMFGKVAIGSSLELYASEKVRLRNAGMPIEDFDLLIACSAVASDCVLVSENVDHMSRIQGLRLENWIER